MFTLSSHALYNHAHTLSGDAARKGLKGMEYCMLQYEVDANASVMHHMNSLFDTGAADG